MLKRIERLQRRVPEPEPEDTPEDKARAVEENCRGVMRMIETGQLVDGANGAFPAADLDLHFWDVLRERDVFLCVVAPFAWRWGVTQEPAGPMTCQDITEQATAIIRHMRGAGAI